MLVFTPILYPLATVLAHFSLVAFFIYKLLYINKYNIKVYYVWHEEKKTELMHTSLESRAP